MIPLNKNGWCQNGYNVVFLCQTLLLLMAVTDTVFGSVAGLDVCNVFKLAPIKRVALNLSVVLMGTIFMWCDEVA